MATEKIGDYQIEYASMRITEVGGWSAWLTIYGPSRNPMHRNDILPHQRVAVAHVFSSAEDAERRARVAGLAMLGRDEGRD